MTAYLCINKTRLVKAMSSLRMKITVTNILELWSENISAEIRITAKTHNRVYAVATVYNFKYIVKIN